MAHLQRLQALTQKTTYSSLVSTKSAFVGESQVRQHRRQPLRLKGTRVFHILSVDEETSVASTSDYTSHESALLLSGKRIAVFKAQKTSNLSIEEQTKPLAEYMTLPASQYSVLDANRIERLDADTFRCYVEGLHFFKFHVEPVLTLSVIVGERGPTVRLLDTQLQGSKIVQQANEKFTATMTNSVEWRHDASSGALEIASDTSIQVTLEVPAWFVVPTAMIEKTGCAVMERVLETAVPRFLEQLKADYGLWAAGDESR